ncbi:WD40-repeat-containing domain protein, partial [Vararia minispora EC-137]
ILYTGGRDGMVIAWDLGLPMKRRAHRYGHTAHPGSRWEFMTGWADDVFEDELDDGDILSDGDILGEVKGSARRRRGSVDDSGPIPPEDMWELDADAFVPGKPSQFRQATQAHTDWVNDILLCNNNQTLVSASSDGSVKAWNPHDTPVLDPTLLGMHEDYVRCLTQSRAHNWVASGSFDRTIKLWDLSRRAALLTLNPPESAGPKASVYALSVDPLGHTVVSGGPERVVRMWDPRAGKRIGKLVGHTDNIRSILVSEDSRYLLTASADASIKLWSLVSQRCLHTFTHHTDSVWSLHSSHPSLQIFYSGDKSGYVCKVDVEGCTDTAEGECALVCQDRAGEGIIKLAALDDALLWTAAGTSSLRRWRAPPRRAVRAASLTLSGDSPNIPPSGSPDAPSAVHARRAARARTVDVPHTPPPVRVPRHAYTVGDEGEAAWYGLPFESLVRLTSPLASFSPGPPRGAADADVATLYSAASVHSVPLRALSPRGYALPSAPRAASPHSAFNRSARAEFEEREVAADAVPLAQEPDEEVCGGHGLVRAALLNDRMHALTVDSAGEVAVWDILRCACVGRIAAQDIAMQCAVEGRGGCVSPRDALELVRERVEGGSVVVPWCTVDARVGVLTVHLGEKCWEAEVYADEAGVVGSASPSSSSSLNLGKWVLRSLFSNFVREELRARTRPPSLKISTNGAPVPTPPASPTNSTVFTAPHALRAVVPPQLETPRPALPPVATKFALHQPLSPILRSPSVPGADATPRAHGRAATESAVSPAGPQHHQQEGDYFAPRADDFSGWTRAKDGKESGNAPAAPSGGAPSGRLEAARGRVLRRELGCVLPHLRSRDDDGHVLTLRQDPPAPAPTPSQTLLAGPLSPPASDSVLVLPPSTRLIVSEQHPAGWSAVYRGTVASAAADVRALEDALPFWLLEYLLCGRAPVVPIVKVSFVLLPWKGEGEEALPELLNTAQSKLTASRFLRVRKLTAHVQDKLDRLAAASSTHPTPSPRSSVDTHSLSHSPHARKAEEAWEILCNDVVLPLDMTLAAVRQYVWKQTAELTMHYRRK